VSRASAIDSWAGFDFRATVFGAGFLAMAEFTARCLTTTIRSAPAAPLGFGLRFALRSQLQGAWHPPQARIDPALADGQQGWQPFSYTGSRQR
jgi:hypothetical protein